MSGITFTPEALSKTFVTYREALIQQLMLGMADILPYVSVLQGIRYKQVWSEMSGKFEMSNYKKDRLGTGDVAIKQRELETFFGNCIEPIDPNSIYQSIWGSNIVKGDALKTTPIAVQVCGYIMKQLGENQYLNLFTAKHVDGADGTSNWFNGFQTILEQDITNGDLTEAQKNLYTFTSSIDADNAEDAFKDFYWGSDPVLRSQKLNLFVSDAAYHNYTEAYQKAHGALPYNTAYDKKTLEGASNVRIVNLPCVPDDFMLLTTRENMKLLFNQKTDDDRYIVERSLKNHFDLDFIATAFFGTQFLSVNPRTLRYGKKQG